jgi:hypothetical protein
MTQLAPRLRSDNPSDLFWKPELPMEVAMQAVPVRQLLLEYGISEQDWEAHYVNNPLFISEVKRWIDFLKEEGASFRLKARLQAEHLLDDHFNIIADKKTPAKERIKGMENLVRWAGYDQKAGTEGGQVAPFNIVIQMNNGA